MEYHYEYDDLNRVLSRKLINSVNGKVIDTEEFTYDLACNITSFNESGNSLSLEYNNADNRLLSGGGNEFNFDKDGNMILNRRENIRRRYQ